MTAIERAGYLAHACSAAFARRVAEAERAIAEWLSRVERPYIAFSTGKDSTVTAALVWQHDPTVPAVYIDAQCAFPESSDLLDRLESAGRPIVRWPCRPFLDILADAGGPDAPGVEEATMRATVYEPIASLQERYRFDGAAVGLRGEESRERGLLLATRGLVWPNGRYGVLECTPVARWKHADIWAAIVGWGLDYCRAYDRMGALPERNRRISYWAGETNRRQGRWSFVREHYPALWRQYQARFPEVGRFV